MANLSKPFIERPVFTSLFMAAIVFFGVLSYFSLPVSDLPSIQYPTIQITTSYPGANPDTIANTVTSPLERQFSTIDNVKTIASTSSNGSSNIVLIFGLDKPLEVAAQDVQNAINQAMPNLPNNLPNNPVYNKVNPADTPILVYSLSSNSVPKGEIYDYAYSLISNRISMVEGVSQVQIYGAPSAVRIQVNPDLLSSKEISLGMIANSVRQSNPDLPTGTLYGPYKEFNINVFGQLLKAKGYNDLVVRNNKGAMVKLKDIGRALDSLKDDKMSLNYYKDEYKSPGVVLAIRKQPGSNTVKVIQGIQEKLPTLLKELPKAIDLHTIFDQSFWIFESVEDVEVTLLVAFMLVGLVTLFYLGKTIDTIIPVLVLPMTILGTFVFMYLFGFSLDILSLLSLTLAIGFLIDDAIVVLENTVRHLEEGKNRMQAAMDAAKQISFTVVSTSAALIAVFIPMLFMGGMIGRIFREFAATIVIAVVISTIMALSLTPLLCSRFLSESNKDKKNWIERISTKINTFMLNHYKKGLKWTLNHKAFTLFCGFLSVVATVALFEVIPKDFLPPDDLGFIQGFTQLEEGTSPFETMRIQNKIATITKNNPNVEEVVSVGAQPYDNQAIFYVHLKPLKERKPILEVMNELYQEFGKIVGAKVFMKSFPLINLDIGTQSSKGNYQYALQGFDQKELYRYAQTFISKMQTLPGIEHVTSDLQVNMPQIDVSIDRDKASSYNVTATEIENALMYAYGGTKISMINTPINQYDVILETIPSAYKDPSVMNKIYVGNQDNKLVPLSQMTNWKETSGPLTVNHINTAPSVLVSFDLNDIPLSTALENIENLRREVLPPNIIGTVQGSASAFQSTFKELLFLIFVAIFIIYVILGILYENFIHPITVMSSLPPAALSGLFTLLIFNETISLYAFIGLIMLVGIVMKNGIIMVDFANEALQQNLYDNPQDAVYYSATTRFRPIIMTTFSTLMGALPIALGIGGLTAESRQPVGLVIVGGLLFSQLLTLFFTPVVYIYLEKMRLFFTKKKQKELPSP